MLLALSSQVASRNSTISEIFYFGFFPTETTIYKQIQINLAAAQTEHQVKGGLLLDVVVGEGAAILELLAGEDQALLIGGDALLVLDLALDHIDGVGALDLEGDGLA